MRNDKFKLVFFTIMAFSLPLSISLAQFFFSLIVFYVFFKVLKRETADTLYFPYPILFALFILFPIFSFPNAENISKAMVWYKRHLYVITLVASIPFLTQLKEKKEWLLKAYLLGASVSSFVAILQPFWGLNFDKPFNPKTYYVFSTGLLSHPLTYSETTSFAIIIGLYFFFEKTKNQKEKIFYLFLLILNFTGIIFSREKMPLIATILISFFFIFTYSYKTKSLKNAILVAIIFLLIPAAIPNKKKIMWRFQKEKINYSLKARGEMWTKSIREFKENPFLGIGFGNFFITIKKWNKKGYDKLYHAHSNFFELLATTGIIGVIIFYLFHFFIFKDLFFSLKNGIDFPFVLAILSIFLLYHFEGISECTFKDTELNLQLYFFLATFYSLNCPFIKNKNKTGKNKKPS